MGSTAGTGGAAPRILIIGAIILDRVLAVRQHRRLVAERVMEFGTLRIEIDGRRQFDRLADIAQRDEDDPLR